EQAIALAPRQGGIGLIENKHARALTDGARNLDELHLGDREPANPRFGIERLDAETVERGARLLAHHRPRDERGDATARYVRHDDIFGDRHGRAKRELLIDHDDAGRAAVERRGETGRLAIDKNPTLVRLKIACKDVHERGFA